MLVVLEPAEVLLDAALLELALDDFLAAVCERALEVALAEALLDVFLVLGLFAPGFCAVDLGDPPSFVAQ